MSEIPKHLILEAMTAHKVPGVSIAIDIGGKICSHTFGVRNAVSQEPVSDTTSFQAGSISKVATALLTLALVERGVLSLEEEIPDHCLGLRVVPNGLQPPTISDILSHSAGFTVHGFRGYPRGSALPTIGQIIAGLPPANNPPIGVSFSPRSEYRYSGGGYVVLQHLISQKLSSDFAEIAERFLLKPAGCEFSTFRDAPLTPPASGHKEGKPIPQDYHLYPEKAAAGLWSTPADVCRMLGQIHLAFTGKSAIISQPLARRMLSPRNDHYGLGVRMRTDANHPRLQIEHGGVNAGYDSYFRMLPLEGKSAVVFTNGNSGMKFVTAMFPDIRRILCD